MALDIPGDDTSEGYAETLGAIDIATQVTLEGKNCVVMFRARATEAKLILPNAAGALADGQDASSITGYITLPANGSIPFDLSGMSHFFLASTTASQVVELLYTEL